MQQIPSVPYVTFVFKDSDGNEHVTEVANSIAARFVKKARTEEGEMGYERFLELVEQIADEDEIANEEQIKKIR